MPQEGLRSPFINYVYFYYWYTLYDILKALYMNAVIQVGFLKKFIEIYVNKVSRIQIGWSELEKKEQTTLASEPSRKFKKKMHFFIMFGIFSLGQIIHSRSLKIICNGNFGLKRGGGGLLRCSL